MKGMRMDIAHLITDLDVGGAEQNLEALARTLAGRGHRVTVASLMPPGAVGERLAEAGIPVADLHMTGRADVRVLTRLGAWLRRERPDVLHTWLFHANALGRIVAAACRVPAVVSSVRVAEPRRWHLFLERLTQGLADRIVANSEGLMRYMIARGIREKRITCIPNSVDLGRFTQVPQVSSPAPSPVERGVRRAVALFVGRLHRQKGVDVLLEAARRLRDVDFLIAGEGPDRLSLESAARDLENVRFLGFRDDVAELLAAADVLVLPSRWEGLPNVLLEAMASGRPVVATSVVGSADLIEDGENGLLVPPEDPEALASAIRRLVADAGLVQKLRTKGLATARNYSNEAATNRYESLYRAVCR